MAVETIKMSSKGQIVIPRGIREDIDAVVNFIRDQSETTV